MKSNKRHLPVLPEGFEDPTLPKGTFSHSQYSMFKKCGRAYEFKYVEGRSLLPRGAMFKGTVIHQGAEFSLLKKLEQKAPILEEALTHISAAFDAEKETVEVWDEGETAGLAKDRTIYGYTAYHRAALPTINPISVEQPFAVKIGTVPVIGFIDLLDNVKLFNDAHDPGYPVVADLKYSSASWSQADVDMDPQFTLYAMATGLSDIRVDNLVDLKAGPTFKQRSSKRSPAAKEVLTEDYDQVADFVRRGIFPMAPIDSWQCTAKWCGYYQLCRGRRS